MVYGIYHQISAKHCQRYLDEFMYRFNSRKLKDADRFVMAMKRVEGRLTYKRLIASKVPVPAPLKLGRVRKPVIQRQGDEFIGQYPSLANAAKATGVNAYFISKCARGLIKSAGGFQWDLA